MTILTTYPRQCVINTVQCKFSNTGYYRVIDNELFVIRYKTRRTTMEDYEEVTFKAWTENDIWSEEVDVNFLNLPQLINNAKHYYDEELLGWKIECGEPE